MTKSAGFQCKQFFVAHEQCAMKVGTDSLILGSIANPSCARRVLDIGTGSGLLALMMAQKSNAGCRVDAVELESQAARQAADNFAKSVWAARLSVHQTDIAQFEPDGKYDLIISNPPYFSDAKADTRAYSEMTSQRKLARIEQGLAITDFFRHCARLLADTGAVYCVYPFQRHNDVVLAANHAGFYSSERWIVRNKAQSTPTVNVYKFTTANTAERQHGLVIRESDNAYTSSFKQLCQDFYVNF